LTYLTAEYFTADSEESLFYSEILSFLSEGERCCFASGERGKNDRVDVRNDRGRTMPVLFKAGLSKAATKATKGICH
jgi:hypothetical protein